MIKVRILVSLIVIALLGDLAVMGLFSSNTIDFKSAAVSLVITYIIVGTCALGIWRFLKREDNLGYIDRRR